MSDGSGIGGLGMSAIDMQTQMAMSQGPQLDERTDGNAIEAARKFESYLAQVMLREMRKTVPEGGIFSGPPMDTFIDMFDKTVADRIAEGGRLGLANQLAQSLGGQASTGAPGFPGLPPVSGLPARTIPLHGADHHGHPELPGVHDAKAGIWPVEGRVSSTFGRRSDPFTGEHRHHAGLDIAAPAGTPIRAVESGEVILAGKRRGYGNVVMVRHDDGTTGLYAHCKGLDVRTGARIQAGQRIATVGSTGRATGPHLHFELRADGSAVDPQSIYNWHGR